MGVYGEKAIGSFYLKSLSDGEVHSKTIEYLRKEIDGTVNVTYRPLAMSETSSMASSRTSSSGSMVEDKPKFVSMLWAQLERLSSNFRPIKS